MSKRHQASRRRSYGRRQHELHERSERMPEAVLWIGSEESDENVDRWSRSSFGRAAADDWLALRGVD